MARKKPLVRKEEVKEATNLQHEQIRSVVQNQEAVSGYLRLLADQTANDPNVHSEITRSATLLAVFLEAQIKGARAQHADAFKE